MNPLRRHRKEHDIYSFGVLLFEIGRRYIMDLYFKSLARNGHISQIKEKMPKRTHYLGQDNGVSYENAVNACLEGDFGISVDDRMYSALARAFEEQVLENLVAGARLDG